jgi:hypothetical protein
MFRDIESGRVDMMYTSKIGKLLVRDGIERASGLGASVYVRGASEEAGHNQV